MNTESYYMAALCPPENLEMELELLKSNLFRTTGIVASPLPPMVPLFVSKQEIPEEELKKAVPEGNLNFKTGSVVVQDGTLFIEAVPREIIRRIKEDLAANIPFSEASPIPLFEGFLLSMVPASGAVLLQKEVLVLSLPAPVEFRFASLMLIEFYNHSPGGWDNVEWEILKEWHCRK